MGLGMGLGMGMGMGMGNWNGKVPLVPGDDSIIFGATTHHHHNPNPNPKVDSDSNILGELNMITEKIINYLKKMVIMKNVLSSPFNCDDNKQ